MALIVLVMSAVSSVAADNDPNFYILNRQNGLSDNCVLQLHQLADGRMVTVTELTIDIYDGQRFNTMVIDTTRWVNVPAYSGATHLFADQHDRLWMKQWGRLYCFDLRTMRQEISADWHYDDFFIDQQSRTWYLKDSLLLDAASDSELLLPQEAGRLQDVVARADTVYTFFDSGMVIAWQPDGRQLYQSIAYGPDVSERYRSTSLVVCGSDSYLYQVRTGDGGSVLQSFDTHTRQWRQLLSSSDFMHTLTLTPTGMIYLTTPEGYLYINPATGERQTFNELHLPDGSILSTGINAVCLDREGGVWLGTYNSGVLYTSPLSGLFDTHPLNIEIHPILTTIYLHGMPLQPGAVYEGRTLLEETPPYVEHISFSHQQNSLAFQFSTMNYVRPRSTCYRYRFSGEGSQWHTLSADSAGRLVDDNGVFYLPLVGLSPGDYTLEVMASANARQWNEDDVRRIRFTIEHPWWQTAWAWLLYLVLLTAVVVLAFWFYRRKLQRQSREQMLLLRIQNLAKQVSQYEHPEAMVVLSEPESQQEETEQEPTSQEKLFMERATLLVEQHLATPQYGVEQLAADLCMERTGLYKKLTSLIEQSPVAFIRSIRLRRAADLLRQGQLSVAEIASRTGFSSTSYFSKCFQKEFGCKPSEYTGDEGSDVHNDRIL